MVSLLGLLGGPWAAHAQTPSDMDPDAMIQRNEIHPMEGLDPVFKIKPGQRIRTLGVVQGYRDVTADEAHVRHNTYISKLLFDPVDPQENFAQQAQDLKDKTKVAWWDELLVAWDFQDPPPLQESGLVEMMILEHTGLEIYVQIPKPDGDRPAIAPGTRVVLLREGPPHAGIHVIPYTVSARGY